MKLIKTTEAVGHVLCHDMTQIIPGKSKGPVFKKGHIVTEEDIPVLVEKFGIGTGRTGGYYWLSAEDVTEIYRIAAHTPPVES